MANKTTKLFEARIICPYGMYYGEVKLAGLWTKVTSNCFTKWGVERELKKWKKEYIRKKYLEEFLL